jgi:hypothetical protein
MKSSIHAVLVVSILATPIVTFAQQNEPITRDQVRAELVQLQQSGYNANASDAAYPSNVQEAQARVAAQNQAQGQAAAQDSGYGTSSSGTSQSGHAAVPLDTSSLFSRH